MLGTQHVNIIYSGKVHKYHFTLYRVINSTYSTFFPSFPFPFLSIYLLHPLTLKLPPLLPSTTAWIHYVCHRRSLRPMEFHRQPMEMTLVTSHSRLLFKTNLSYVSTIWRNLSQSVQMRSHYMTVRYACGVSERRKGCEPRMFSLSP